MRTIPLVLVATLPLALLLAGPARGQETASDRTPSEREAPVDRAADSGRASRVVFEIQPIDAALAPALRRYATEGAERVESLFGAPFARPVTVVVFPDRAAFDAHLREAWGMGETACWMVGGAEEEALVLLSPRVWREEACDHDPDDADHVRDLVAHELVHVYHMQANPSDEFEGVEGLDWFVEGVATWASGQLERSHAGRAREAVESGAAPVSLDDAWTGPYRYGVAGSMAAFVAERVGAGRMADLLDATTRGEVLDAVELDEAAFLEAWARWVAAGSPAGVSGSGGAPGPAGG